MALLAFWLVPIGQAQKKVITKTYLPAAKIETINQGQLSEYILSVPAPNWSVTLELVNRSGNTHQAAIQTQCTVDSTQVNTSAVPSLWELVPNYVHLLDGSSGVTYNSSGSSAVISWTPNGSLKATVNAGACALIDFLITGTNAPITDPVDVFYAVSSAPRAGMTAPAPYPLTTTSINALTAVFNQNQLITEKGPRWSVISNPAAGSQATASKAAAAGVRHVADCVAASAGAATAPAAATHLNIALRDGASGVGTIIWTTDITAAASAAQHGNIFICGLNLIGSANTAMTLEFGAGLANEFESVTITGYDVQ